MKFMFTRLCCRWLSSITQVFMFLLKRYVNILSTAINYTGGVYLTIAGSGFTAFITVTVGEDDCEVVSRNSSTIVCETPPGNGSQEVNVTVSSTTSFTDSYEYNSEETIFVTSFDPDTASPAGEVYVFASCSNTSFV